MRIIAIDPGLTGAICTLDDGEFIAMIDMPTVASTPGAKVKQRVDAATLARQFDGIATRDAIVAIERIASMPGQGTATMLSLGDTFGCIRGVAAALQFRVEFIEPAVWKRYFKVPGKDKGGEEAARTLCLQRWPELVPFLGRKKDHNRADARLIAQFVHETIR